MGSSSSKELPHKKEYIINKITLGKLWNFYAEPETCINCPNEKIFAVVSYLNKKQLVSHNYSRSCLFYSLSIRWQSIYSTNLPIELKQRIFRRYMSTIT